MKTSENKIFYWQGNTSHPMPAAWRDLVNAFVRHIRQRYGKDEVRTWFFESGTSLTSPASGKAATRRPTSSFTT